MRVFYYQYFGQYHLGRKCPDRTYLVCVKGGDAGGNSPIWNGCNTSSWLVPGTFTEED